MSGTAALHECRGEEEQARAQTRLSSPPFGAVAVLLRVALLRGAASSTSTAASASLATLRSRFGADAAPSMVRSTASGMLSEDTLRAACRAPAATDDAGERRANAFTCIKRVGIMRIIVGALRERYENGGKLVQSCSDAEPAFTDRCSPSH